MLVSSGVAQSVFFYSDSNVLGGAEKAMFMLLESLLLESLDREEWQPTLLLDDRPVVCGRHPVHLYHGYLGARSFAQRGTLSCYDPAFQGRFRPRITRTRTVPTQIA